MKLLKCPNGCKSKFFKRRVDVRLEMIVDAYKMSLDGETESLISNIDFICPKCGEIVRSEVTNEDDTQCFY